MGVLEEFEKQYKKTELPQFRVGETVKVYHKIKEGEKERTQVFQGVVIGIKGSGLNRNFTVRKISFTVGVEKTFPYHTPSVEKVEVVRSGRVRRAKLYFLRDRVGKSARLREKTQSGR